MHEPCPRSCADFVTLPGDGHATVIAHADTRALLLNYFIHRITHALSEGFNSHIQQLKAAARGFGNFADYRSRILFFLGFLNLTPL